MATLLAAELTVTKGGWHPGRRDTSHNCVVAAILAAEEGSILPPGSAVQNQRILPCIRQTKGGAAKSAGHDARLYGTP